MCSSHTRTFRPIVDFVPPQRHDGKSSYIWFWQVDPVTNKLRRKKYMLDRFKRGKERDLAANRIIANIINHVAHGWNVWAPQTTSRGDTAVSDVLDRYHQNITSLYNKNVLKRKTYMDYTSRLKILREYIDEYTPETRIIAQFDQAFFVDFLDYLLIDRDLSAKTRNNYRTWCSTLCTWLTEKKYLLENPIAAIHQLPEHDKFRQPLSHDDLKKLGNYLAEHNKAFLLAVMMEYFTAIRPTELSYIKLKDISIKEGSVFVSSQISKNRRDGKIKLPNRVIKLMLDLKIFDSPGNFYLFGKDFRPNQFRQLPVHFTLTFNKFRDLLHFPKCYMFYSLKDSGLRDIANAKGIEVAQKQARHSSVQTTNMYLKGHGLQAVDTLADFEGYL